MSGNHQDSKILKWVKNASEYKLGKITENKKYNKELQNQQTIDIDEFMVELETIEAKQEKTSKLLSDELNKAKAKKSKLKDKEKKIPKERNQQICEEIENIKQVESEISKEKIISKQKGFELSSINQGGSQKIEKQNSIRQRAESISRQSDPSIENLHKILIIEDESSKQEKQISEIDDEEEKIQKKINQKEDVQPSKIITKNGKDKKLFPKMICDACVQTEDTSDVNGYDILKLIQLEQHFVFALHNFHEKLLKLLDNQI